MSTEPTDTTPTDELSIRRRKAELGAEMAKHMRDIYACAKEYAKLGVPSAEWLPVVAGHLPRTVGAVLMKVGSYLNIGIDYALTLTPGAAEATGPLDPNVMMEMAAKAGLQAGRAARPDDGKLSYGEVDEGAPYGPSMPHARRVSRKLLATHAELQSGTTDVAKSKWGLDDLCNLAVCFASYDNDWKLANERPDTVRMRELVDRLFDDASAERGDNPGEAADQAPAMDATVLLRGLQQPLSGSLSTTPEGTLRLLTPVPDKSGQIAVMMEQFFDAADLIAVALQRKVTMQTAKPASNIILSPS